MDGALLPFIRQTMGNTFTPQPSAFLAARVTTACFGVATVIGAMLLAVELGMSRWSALLAGAIAAVNPLLVLHSQIMSPDVPSALFCTLTLIGAVRALRTSSLGAYAFGGVMTGLAAASKYNAGLVGVSLAVSAALGSGSARTRVTQLGWAALVSIVTFLLTCPYMILDAFNAWKGTLDALLVYQTGHLGSEGHALQFNVTWIWKIFGAPVLLVLLAARHPQRRGMIPVAIFVGLYFAMLSVQLVRFERNLAPIVPAIAVLIGAGTEVALIACRRRVWFRIFPALATLAAVLVVAPGAYELARDWAAKYGDHTREMARVWVSRNVALGASILADSYAPYADPAAYRVTDARFALQKPPSDFQNYDVVIVTKAGSGRLLRGGEAAAAQAKLQSLRERACEQREFPEKSGNPDIWVFKLRC
jgi:4-amino-4-deoxy-L-arabinose transferase-like glycosyltransferase